MSDATLIIMLAILVIAILIVIFAMAKTIKDQNLLINSINKRLIYLVVQSTDVLGLFTSKSIGDLEDNSQKLQQTIAGMDKPSQQEPSPSGEKKYNPFNDKDVT